MYFTGLTLPWLTDWLFWRDNGTKKYASIGKSFSLTILRCVKALFLYKEILLI